MPKRWSLRWLGQPVGVEPRWEGRDPRLKRALAPSSPLNERVVCPCGCIFQAVSVSDECWTCGRSAGAIKAAEDRIIASIRALPELDPSA